MVLLSLTGMRGSCFLTSKCRNPEQQIEIALSKAGIDKDEDYTIERFEVFATGRLNMTKIKPDYTKLDNGVVHCRLCPHNCHIKPDKKVCSSTILTANCMPKATVRLLLAWIR